MHFALVSAAYLCLCGKAMAEKVENWDRGPIELEDQFPLAMLHSNFIAASPAVLEKGSFRLRSSFAWTNTVNRTGTDFLIDAEVRSQSLSVAYSPIDNFEVVATLPIVWRGGGVLDSFIYDWHDFFGLPQGPRNDPDIENDNFEIVGINDDGSGFSLTRSGTYLGDLQIGGKFLISEGTDSLPAWALTASLQLPTGAKTYGQDSIDIVTGVLASKRWGWFTAYSGLGYTFIGDQETENLHFNRHRISGFTHFEARVWKKISFLVGLHASSSLIKDVRRFPNYQLYLDTGGKIELSDSLMLELLVRENPDPAEGTADVTFLVGISMLFDKSTPGDAQRADTDTSEK